MASAWTFKRIRSCADRVSSSESAGACATASIGTTGIAVVAASIRAILRRVTFMTPLYELWRLDLLAESLERVRALLLRGQT